MNVGDAAIMGVVSGHIIVLRGSLLAIIIAVAFCCRRAHQCDPALATLAADPGSVARLAGGPGGGPGGGASSGAGRQQRGVPSAGGTSGHRGASTRPGRCGPGVGPPQACAVSPRRRYRRRCAAVRAMMRTIAQCRGARGPAWQPGAITARGTLPDPGPAADRQRSDPAELCRGRCGRSTGRPDGRMSRP